MLQFLVDTVSLSQLLCYRLPYPRTVLADRDGTYRLCDGRVAYLNFNGITWQDLPQEAGCPIALRKTCNIQRYLVQRRTYLLYDTGVEYRLIANECQCVGPLHPTCCELYLEPQ